MILGLCLIWFCEHQVVFSTNSAMSFLQEAVLTAREDSQIPRVGAVGVEPPVFTKKVMPEYVSKGEQVTASYAIIEAVFGKDGKIRDIKLLKGLGDGFPDFEAEAMAALKQWEYVPGRLNGKPADVRMTLQLRICLLQ